MHRYQPRIHLILRSDPSSANVPVTDLEAERYRTFVFSETIFTAVTAYQNQLVSSPFSSSSSVDQLSLTSSRKAHTFLPIPSPLWLPCNFTLHFTPSSILSTDIWYHFLINLSFIFCISSKNIRTDHKVENRQQPLRKRLPRFFSINRSRKRDCWELHDWSWLSSSNASILF